jgi:hypothetical protein
VPADEPADEPADVQAEEEVPNEDEPMPVYNIFERLRSDFEEGCESDDVALW